MRELWGGEERTMVDEGEREMVVGVGGGSTGKEPEEG